jgi:DNA-directed RNA polymerase beta subunit
MGIYSGVYPIRMDTVNKVQTWPSRPIFTTQMQDIIGLSDLPQGENALVAIMTKGGWGQEDGLIVSKRAADRGLFSHIIYAMEQITLLKSEGYVESFAAPPSREGKNAQIFAGVGDDGLPIIGAQLVEGSAYGVKVRKTVGDPRPQYVIEKIGFAHQGIVERYIIGVNHDGHTFARIKIAQLSPAIVGSKLVLRVAMKGTITRIAPDEELPYFLAKDGTKIVPDLIVNPHSIPARMSVGLLVELLMGKAAAINGRDVDATSFRKLDVDGAVETLRSKGYNPYGKEQFYDPVTDRPIETLIFAGFAYTSILPAIPGLKIQSRNKGAKRLLTRQPSRGADASQSTGMRIGTQERDALVSHGASELLRERLCTASDEHVDIFCATCGRVALSNINTGEVSCPNCGENTKFGCVRMPFAFHTFTSLLAGGGLGIRFGFENPEQKAAREAAGLPPPVPQYVEDQDEEEESESETEI